MAYKSVTASIAGSVLSAQLDPGQTFGGRAVGNAYNLPGMPTSQIYFGAGIGQINLLCPITGTLTAGTTLIDLTAVLDPYGASKNFARAKVLAILNLATADGANLLVGGAAANAWAAPFNGVATSKLVIGPGWVDPLNNTSYVGYFLLASANATAYPVTGTSKVLQLDSGASTIPYAVGLLGCDA
jgi:hypothetical protein